jgi:hypothetical protein
VKIPAKYISEAYIRSRVKTYETNAPRDGGRKRDKDINSWAQPLCQSLVATARFVKFSNLILNDSKDGGSRAAGLQLGGKRMFEKVFLGLLSVGLQCRLEDSLEV